MELLGLFTWLIDKVLGLLCRGPAVRLRRLDDPAQAVKRLRGKIWYAPIAYQLVPAKCTLLQLRSVHEAVLGRPLAKDGFRRRIIASGLVEPPEERATDVSYRPPTLYRFLTPDA